MKPVSLIALAAVAALAFATWQFRQARSTQARLEAATVERERVRRENWASEQAALALERQVVRSQVEADEQVALLRESEGHPRSLDELKARRRYAGFAREQGMSPADFEASIGLVAGATPRLQALLAEMQAAVRQGATPASAPERFQQIYAGLEEARRAVEELKAAIGPATYAALEAYELRQAARESVSQRIQPLMRAAGAALDPASAEQLASLMVLHRGGAPVPLLNAAVVAQAASQLSARQA